ncbi:hypothetical protein GGI23_001156 [Coemansia sp. RSA 2559]|nr:hypothetical protein GGI23_001156 [Coemansia sp. RSA 2559]
MQLTRAILFATLSTLASSIVVPIKRDNNADMEAALSEMLSSISTAYDDPAAASSLLSSALGYISSDLPNNQKPIKQDDLESIVSKYAPEVAPSMVDGLLSSAMGYFSRYNLPNDVKSQLSSAIQYISNKAGNSISDIMVSAMNKEAPVYRLDGDIGTPTAATNDDGSSASKSSNSDKEEETIDSTQTSGASIAKMASVCAAAVGAVAILF